MDDFATRLQSDVDKLEDLGLSEESLAGKFLDLRAVMSPRPFSVGEDSSCVGVHRVLHCRRLPYLTRVSSD
eukprot:COSAG06_NODE_53237_length_301_cov_0.762376_1_plen_70_part_01